MTATQEVQQLLSSVSCPPDVVEQVTGIVCEMERKQAALNTRLFLLWFWLDGLRKGREVLLRHLRSLGVEVSQ